MLFGSSVAKSALGKQFTLPLRRTTLIRFVLFALVLAFVACSDPAPIAPLPAGKANCALCALLGDDKYTIPDGQGDPTASEEEDDETPTETEDDNAQAEDEDDGTPTGDGAGPPYVVVDFQIRSAGTRHPTIDFQIQILLVEPEPAETILFADSNLESAVRQALAEQLEPFDGAYLELCRQALEGLEAFKYLDSTEQQAWLESAVQQTRQALDPQGPPYTREYRLPDLTRR